jgi:hypothetical protein
MLLFTASLPPSSEGIPRAVFFPNAFFHPSPSTLDPKWHRIYTFFPEGCLNSLLFFSDTTCCLIFLIVIEVFSLVLRMWEIHAWCALATVISTEIELLGLAGGWIILELLVNSTLVLAN